MTSRAAILLIASDPHTAQILDSRIRILGEPRIMRVKSLELLTSTLERFEFYLALIKAPIPWSETQTIVRRIRNRIPDCNILIISPQDHQRIGEDAASFRWIERSLSDQVTPARSPNNPLAQPPTEWSSGLQDSPEGAWRDEQFQFLLDQAGIGVFCCRTDGRFIKMNQVFSQMLDKLLGGEARKFDQSEIPIETTLLLSLLQPAIIADSVGCFEIRAEGSSETVPLLRIHTRHRRPVWIEGIAEDITLRSLAESVSEQSALAKQRLLQLSVQERMVLNEVVSGARNKSIARRFDISEKTVERHRSNLMKKLDVESVAELVRIASIARLPNEGFP